MSARRPVAVMAALVAGAIVALLAGLILVDRARGRPAGGRSRVSPAPAAPGGGAAEEPTSGSVPGRVPAPGGGGGEEPPPPAPRPAEARRVPGRVETVDGASIAGVTFFDIERLPDGSLVAFLDDSPNDGVESDGEGRFTLEWNREQEEILFLVLGREVEMAAVGNGALVEAQASGEVVRADPAAGPLRLVVRPRPGYGSLRFVDAEDGRVLSRRVRVDLSWVTGVGGGPVQRRRWTATGDAAGWVRVATPQAPPPEGDAVLEIRLDGFAVERMPVGRVRGRTTVPLRTDTPSVTGSILLEPEAQAAGEVRVRAGIRPAGGASAGGIPELRGLPAGPGPFAVHDLPEGSWVMEVHAATDLGVRWASRRFEKWGTGTVDLGTLEVRQHGGIRARVVDGEGAVLRSVPVAVRRVPAETPGGSLEAGGGGDGVEIVGTGSIRIVRFGDAGTGRVELAGDVHVPAVEADRDAEGWQVHPDLLPGGRYEVSARGIPGLKQEVVVVDGRTLDVELRWDRRMVRCTLRFTYKGREPVKWGPILQGPPAPGDWKQDGILTADFPPGRHAIIVFVSPEREGTFVVARGEVEVPEGETFDAVVDLK